MLLNLFKNECELGLIIHTLHSLYLEHCSQNYRPDNDLIVNTQINLWSDTLRKNQPLEVVSPYRDPQLQVDENYSLFPIIWDQTFANIATYHHSDSPLPMRTFHSERIMFPKDLSYCKFRERHDRNTNEWRSLAKWCQEVERGRSIAPGRVHHVGIPRHRVHHIPWTNSHLTEMGHKVHRGGVHTSKKTGCSHPFRLILITLKYVCINHENWCCFFQF